MSKKTNPTVIGAFVVGGVLLLAVGVAMFGGAELLAKRTVYVAYFTEDTQGLRVGSNVMMNGVQIGFVTNMSLLVDRDDFESQTEVIIEFLPESLLLTHDGVVIGDGMTGGVSHDELVNRGGLRATLQAESFVTGQLLIDMRFRPETVPVMRGGEGALYPEIPTFPSDIQELLAKIQNWIGNLGEELDTKELTERLNGILRGADELMNSQDLRESLTGINKIINTEESQELTASLQVTLEEFRSAANDVGSLIRNADTKLDAVEIKLIVERLVGTLDEAQWALAAAKLQMRGESVQSYQLGATLKEVESAARAMRELMDYLERNPEAILQGKGQ
ncbi:MAG: MlaD family protein [Pirellulaceae bacterium]